MKLFNKVAVACVGGLMAISVGVGLINNSDSKKAVYAAGPYSVTYKQSSSSAASKTDGTAPTGSSITFKNTYTTKDQLTKGNNMTYTISGYSGYTITSMTLSMKSNSKAGTGSLSVTAGSTTLASTSGTFNKWYNMTGYSSNYVDVNVALTNSTYVIGDGEKIVINIAATVNSLYCQSVTFTYVEADAPVYATGIEIGVADGVHTLDSNKTVTLEKDSENGTAYVESTVTVTPDDADDKGYTWTMDCVNNEIIVDDNSSEILVDTTKVGKYALTAHASGAQSGNDVSDTIYFDVVDSSAASLVRVDVTGTPTHANQYVGHAFDYSGLTFTAVYDDGTSTAISGSDITWDELTVGSVPHGTYSGLNVSVNNVTVLANTLTVTVTGSMSKTTYATNEAWDNSGLVASGVYADGTVYSGTFTWSYDPATPNVAGVGENITVTATAKAEDNTSASIPCTVSVTAPTYSDIAGIGGTTQYISATQDDTTYYLKENGTSAAPSAVTAKSEATVFEVIIVGDNTYQFKNGDNYLYSTASNNGVRFGTNTNRDWVVASGSRDSGSWDVKHVQTNRFLSLYNLADFRGYTDATTSNRVVNTDFESAKELVKLTISASADAQTRFLKGSTFNPVDAGYSAIIHYSDGTTDDVTAQATWALDTSADTTTAEITATYSGFDAKVENIEIYEVIATKLSIDVTGAKTEYFKNETLDTTGIKIAGLNGDDQVVIEECELSKCTFSPTTLETVGTQTITVIYTNSDATTATGTFEVTVKKIEGYTKITSMEDITFGDSYIFGVENESKKNCLMGGVTGTNKYLDSVASLAISSDLSGINAASLESTVHPFTLVSTGDGIAMYDLKANSFIEGNSSNYAYLKSSYTADCEWKFSYEDGHLCIVWKDTTRVFGYNVGAPRFSTYASYANYNYSMANGTAHPVLYKLEGSAVKTSVEAFNTESLKMDQYVGDDSYNETRCTANYTAMKGSFVELSQAERMLFLDKTTFEAAYARFDSWCRNNNEEYNASTNTFAVIQNSRVTRMMDNGSGTIVMVATILSLSTFGGYFFLRRKKEIN